MKTTTISSPHPGLTGSHPALPLRPAHPLLTRDLQPSPATDKVLLGKIGHLRILLRTPGLASRGLISPAQQQARKGQEDILPTAATVGGSAHRLQAIHRLRAVLGEWAVVRVRAASLQRAVICLQPTHRQWAVLLRLRATATNHQWAIFSVRTAFLQWAVFRVQWAVWRW